MTRSPTRADASYDKPLLLLGAFLFAGGVAGAAPTGGMSSTPATIDSEFRAAYPMSTPPAAMQLAGVALAKIAIPGLQLTARSERAPDDGGVVLSFSDRAGVVRVLVQLAVCVDAGSARRVLDAELHGISTQLAKASDPSLGDLAWADDGGRGTSLLTATQSNIAYSVTVVDGAQGVPTAAAIAGLVRSSMVVGLTAFPTVTVTLPSTIDVKSGHDVRITVAGGYPYKIRAEGGYIARGQTGPIVRPFGPGSVTVHATVIDELARVTIASGSTLAK